MQTNGILIDEEWAHFLSQNHFLVGLFNQYHVEYNILSVITNESAKKASNLYKFYKRNGFAYIQLIPCMDEMTRDTSNTICLNASDHSVAGNRKCRTA